MIKAKIAGFAAALLICVGAAASVEIGLGTTSANGGRIVPALTGGVATSNWGMFFSSTGVANSYYYQSNYQISYYWMFSGGTMWGGKISPGFGLGTMYTIRSFQDEGSTSEVKSDDFAVGPALRMHWIFWNTAYVGVDAIWGLRSLTSLTSLAFQDYTCLSLGAQLW